MLGIFYAKKIYSHLRAKEAVTEGYQHFSDFKKGKIENSRRKRDILQLIPR